MKKHIPSAITQIFAALSLVLLLATAQAVTISKTYNLGPQDSGTTIQPGINGLLPWITKGTLPVGSILRSISVNARLDSMPVGADTWGDDLVVYVDPEPTAPGTAARLQVGGFNQIGSSVTTRIAWGTGIGGPPRPLITTRDVSAQNIDLNGAQLSLGNGFSTGTWSGTITVNYDVTELTILLDSPTDNQDISLGSSITAIATVLDPGSFENVVKFHVTPMDPPGETFIIDSPFTSSPYYGNVGNLDEGTYSIYATTENNDSPPQTATSATHTFRIAPAVQTTITLATPTAASTYGQNATFTATVSPPPTGGTVSFYGNGLSLGSPVPVDTITGQATLSTSTLNVGSNEIIADYNGYQIYIYSTTEAPVIQEVQKATLTVKADNVAIVLNSAIPNPLPYQITGFQNGQNLGTSGVTGFPFLSTLATSASPVGLYVITCSQDDLAAENYDFTFQNGTLTILKPNVVSFSYYRFSSTRLRNDTAANSIQLSEFQLASGSSNISLSSATITNPGGNNPAGEGVLNIRDGNTATKWLDFNRRPLIIQFATPTTIDRYRFATANDSNERDPVSWRLEGSQNGTTWVLLDVRSLATVPTARLTYSDWFQLLEPLSSTYATWAAAHASGQSPNQDFDNDGVKNGVEYFMGATGSTFTTMPRLNSANKVTWPMSAEYNGTYEVQTSPNLVVWTNVTPKPTPSGGNLSYTLPAAAPGGKSFVRLLVTPTP